MPNNDTFDDVLSSVPAPVTSTPKNDDDFSDVLGSASEPTEEHPLVSSYNNIPVENPDEAAKIIKTAKTLDQPEVFVQNNMPVAVAAASAPNLSVWQRLEKNAPATTRWLMHPSNMAVAHDDIDNMELHEKIIYGAADAAIKYSKIAAKDIAEGWTSGGLQRKSGLSGRSSFVNALINDTYVEPAEKALLEKQQEVVTEKNSGKMRPLYWATQQIPNMIGIAKNAFKRGVQGGAIGATTAAAVSGPAGLATVPAAAALGFTLGARVGAAEDMFYLEGESAFDEFIKLKDANGAPISPNLAARGAALVGAVNAGLEYTSLEALLKTIPGLGKITKKGLTEVIKRYLVSVGTEVVTETAQEGVTAGVGEMVKSAAGTPERASIGDILARVGQVIGPTIQSSMVLGFPGSAMGAINTFRGQQVETMSNVHKELGTAAASSKLLERLPDAYKEHVSEVTKNTPMENSYISTSKFEEYAKAKQIEPQALADKLGIGTLYQEAVTSSGDIKVSTSEWVTNAHVAAKELGYSPYADLAEDTKFDAASMTPRQSKETEASITEQVKQESDKITQEVDAAIKADTTGNLEASRKAIYDMRYKELIDAKRPEAEAKASADLFSRLAIRASQESRGTLTPEQANAKLINRVQGVDELNTNPDLFSKSRLLSETKAEIDARPEYMASTALRKKLGPGYKNIAIRAMEKDVLTPKQRKIFESEADAHGLGDAETLIKTIAELPKREDAINEIMAIRGVTGKNERLYQYAEVQLNAAKKMLSEGKTTADIQTETGWKNEAGKWRYAPESISAFGRSSNSAEKTFSDTVMSKANINSDMIRNNPLGYSNMQAVPLYQKAEAINTPEFKKWFGDSKVVDEQGKPLVVYHGTPNASFSEFKNDQFFSKDPNYANRYTTSSTASSSYSGIKDDAPAVYPVYLSIKKPFDTRKYNHRKIYNELFFNKFGNGSKLTDRGLPDWVEARDLVDFLKTEMGDKFDGILIDEGADALGVRPMSYMPFSNTQIKSVFNQGTFDQNNPNILYQAANAPAFYSKLERTIIDKMPNAAPADQIKGILNGAGVKQEEIDWLGIDEFLKDKKKVTKQEMLDFIRANNVQVQEVEKSENAKLKWTAKKTSDGGWNVFANDKQIDLVYGPNSKTAAINEVKNSPNLESMFENYPDLVPNEKTKFSEYQLPSGKNYRELLLTLPDAKGGEFKSSHFDESNILAHVRFNDRTDAEGKKVLFLEEVQSDWHQKGREKGYEQKYNFSKESIKVIGEENTPKKINKYDYENFWMVEIQYPDGQTNKYYGGKEASPDYDKAINSAYEGQSSGLNFNKVPNAPFKKTWHELALKRMVRYAAENGYDKIAWTTGEQQAERYDLSKQIDKLEAWKKSDGKYDIRATKSGKELMSDTFPAEELPGVVGKELAQKIVNGEGAKPKTSYTDKANGIENEMTFAGLDLKVGGEGMKGFYDQMIPSYLNKFGKKFGSKVEKTKMGDITSHSLDITDAMKETALSEGFPLYQAASGAFDPRTRDVLLSFKNANASTFLHESAHAWLSLVDEMVKNGQASDALISDHTKLMSWLGAEYDKPLTVEQQEKFAAAFETYLREGKAPTVELSGAFARFKRWLVRVYRSAKDIGAGILGEGGISDEVRGVMDRMLASEDEVSAAQSKIDYDSVIDLSGVSAPVVNRLGKLRDQAHEEAVGILLKEQMKELSTEGKEFLAVQRARIYGEELAHARMLPENVAIDKLKYILESENVVKQAKDYEKLNEDEKLAFDSVAEETGFLSGNQLAEIVAVSRPVEEVAKARTEERLKAEFPNLKDTDTIKAEAMKAVHNDFQTEVMALERQIVLQKIDKAEATTEAKRFMRNKAIIEADLAKLKAEDILSAKTVGEIGDPVPYFTAERNAAISFAKFYEKGDYVKAAEYKQKQMINHALGVGVIRMKKELDKTLRQLNRLAGHKKEYFRGDENLGQIGSLMERFGLDSPRDFSPEMKKESLQGYLTNLVSTYLSEDEEGSPVVAPEWILNETNTKDVKTLTMDELRDVRDTLLNITHTFVNLDKLYTAKENTTVAIQCLKLADATLANVDKRFKNKVGVSSLDNAERFFRDAAYSLESIDTVISRLDGWKDTGVWRDTVMEPRSKAFTEQSIKMEKYTKDYQKLWSVYSEKEIKSIFNDKIEISEFGITADANMNKQHLLAMALNMGCANKKKLCETMPVGFNVPTWTRENAGATEVMVFNVLGRELDARDWKFVQGVWDTINGLYPEVAELHKRMTGFEPKKVEAMPFEIVTKNGEHIKLDGGYYPLAPDSRVNEKAFEREAAATPLYTELNPSFMAMTNIGHTKARTNASYSVALRLGIINRHMVDVIHDLSFRPFIYDMNRIIKNKTLQGTLKTTIGDTGYRWLKQWVAAEAGSDKASKVSTDAFSRTLRYLTNKITSSVIMGKVFVLTQNFSNSFMAIGAVEGFGAMDVAQGMLVRGVGNYLPKVLFNWKAHRELQEFIWNKDRWMRDRHESPDYTLQFMQGKNVSGKKGISDFFVGLLSGTDDMTNNPLWLQAYYKKIKKGASEDEAVKYARLLISRIVPSGRKSDQAQVIRGGDIERAITKFYSFWSTEYQNWVRQVGMLKQEEVRNVPRFLGFVASRMAFVYASAVLAGKLPEEDDENAKAKWIKEFLGYGVSMFPGFRDIAAMAIDGVLKIPNYGYRPTPIVSVANTVGQASKTLGNIIENGMDADNGQNLFEQFGNLALNVTGQPMQYSAWFWNAYDYWVNNMEPELIDIAKRRPGRER
jgi:hypothetical protein